MEIPEGNETVPDYDGPDDPAARAAAWDQVQNSLKENFGMSDEEAQQRRNAAQDINPNWPTNNTELKWREVVGEDDTSSIYYSDGGAKLAYRVSENFTLSIDIESANKDETKAKSVVDNIFKGVSSLKNFQNSDLGKNIAESSTATTGDFASNLCNKEFVRERLELFEQSKSGLDGFREALADHDTAVQEISKLLNDEDLRNTLGVDDAELQQNVETLKTANYGEHKNFVNASWSLKTISVFELFQENFVDRTESTLGNEKITKDDLPKNVDEKVESFLTNFTLREIAKMTKDSNNIRDGAVPEELKKRIQDVLNQKPLENKVKIFKITCNVADALSPSAPPITDVASTADYLAAAATGDRSAKVQSAARDILSKKFRELGVENNDVTKLVNDTLRDITEQQKNENGERLNKIGGDALGDRDLEELIKAKFDSTNDAEQKQLLEQIKRAHEEGNSQEQTPINQEEKANFMRASVEGVAQMLDATRAAADNNPTDANAFAELFSKRGVEITDADSDGTRKVRVDGEIPPTAAERTAAKRANFWLTSGGDESSGSRVGDFESHDASGNLGTDEQKTACAEHGNNQLISAAGRSNGTWEAGTDKGEGLYSASKGALEANIGEKTDGTERKAQLTKLKTRIDALDSLSTGGDAKAAENAAKLKKMLLFDNTNLGKGERWATGTPPLSPDATQKSVDSYNKLFNTNGTVNEDNLKGPSFDDDFKNIRDGIGTTFDNAKEAEDSGQARQRGSDSNENTGMAERREKIAAARWTAEKSATERFKRASIEEIGRGGVGGSVAEALGFIIKRIPEIILNAIFNLKGVRKAYYDMKDQTPGVKSPIWNFITAALGIPLRTLFLVGDKGMTRYDLKMRDAAKNIDEGYTPSSSPPRVSDQSQAFKDAINGSGSDTLDKNQVSQAKQRIEQIKNQWGETESARKQVSDRLTNDAAKDAFKEADKQGGKLDADAVKKLNAAIDILGDDKTTEQDKQAAREELKKFKDLEEVEEKLYQEDIDDDLIDDIQDNELYRIGVALGILTTEIFMYIQKLDEKVLAAAQNTGCFMYAYDTKLKSSLSPSKLPPPVNPYSIQKIPWLTCSDRAYNWYKSKFHNRTGAGHIGPVNIASTGNRHSTQYCTKCLDSGPLFSTLTDPTQNSTSTKGSYNTNPIGFFAGLDQSNNTCSNYLTGTTCGKAPSSGDPFTESCCSPTITTDDALCPNLTRMNEYGYMLWDCNTTYRKAPSFPIMTKPGDPGSVCPPTASADGVKCGFNINLIDSTSQYLKNTFKTQGAGCYNNQPPIEYTGSQESFTLPWCGTKPGVTQITCTPTGQWDDTVISESCNAPTYAWSRDQVNAKDKKGPSWCYPKQPPSSQSPPPSYNIKMVQPSSPNNMVNTLCLGNMGAQMLNNVKGSAPSTASPTFSSWVAPIPPTAWGNDAMPDLLSDTFGPKAQGLAGFAVDPKYGTYSAEENVNAVGPCVVWNNLPLIFKDVKDADKGGPAFCGSALGSVTTPFCTNNQGDDDGFSSWCGLQKNDQDGTYEFPAFVPDGYALVGQTVSPDLSFLGILGGALCEVISVGGLLGHGICDVFSDIWNLGKKIWDIIKLIFWICLYVFLAYCGFRILSAMYSVVGGESESREDKDGEFAEGEGVELVVNNERAAPAGATRGGAATQVVKNAFNYIMN